MSIKFEHVNYVDSQGTAYEKHALKDVSLEIPQGQFVGIIGHTGSGKSTLLNMLAGLEKPTKGEVVINGQHMEQLNEDGLARFRRENVGFIFQSFHLIFKLSSRPVITYEWQKRQGEKAYIFLDKNLL